MWLLSIQLSRELAGSKLSLGPWNGGREGGGGIHVHVHVIIIICMYDGCQGGRERGGGVYIHVCTCIYMHTMYIVVAVHREDSMRLACANAVLYGHCN